MAFNNDKIVEGSISVVISPLEGKQLYEPQYLSIKPGHVTGCSNSRNLGFYLGYCTEDEYEERVAPIGDAMESYNYIVKALWTIPGFSNFFAEHHSVVSKEDISKQFGTETASLAFSLKSPPYCYPDLIINDCRFSRRIFF